jgi:hypothetical protein
VILITACDVCGGILAEPPDYHIGTVAHSQAADFAVEMNTLISDEGELAPRPYVKGTR